MKSKKTLSLILALMMIISCVPMYASAATALSANNVVEWPTAEGEIYVGQILGEHITLVGGKVEYNGIEIPGKFVHWRPDIVVGPASDTTKANLTFVPDDSVNYKGFNKLFSADVTYKVKMTTPVLADENNPPIATAIKEGQTLSSSAISGGTMKNPYNDKIDLSSRVWQWVDPDMVITESGEYLAKWEGDTKAYEIVTDYIYVEVEKDQKATSLKTMPIVNFDYNPNLTWGTYEFIGATVVITNTDTEVPGTLSIIESWKDVVPGAGSYDVDVVFTPDDTESYIGFTTNVAVTVNAIPISFIDSEGNAVTEGFEFEVDPGTKMGDVGAFLTTVLRVPENSVIQIEDSNNYAENGRTYKLTVIHEDKNYTGNELYFTVKFNTVELTPTFKPGYLKSAVDCGDYKPTGTFTVSLDGKEIATVKANEEFAYTVENSGDHVLSAKYTPAENDYFIIADATQTVNVKLNRTLNRINCNSAGFISVPCGDTVTLSANANAENFDGWAITDAQGNIVDLGVDLTALNITFTMPDYDLNIEAKVKSTSGDNSGLDIELPDIDLELPELELNTDGDHKFNFVNIIQNLIEMLKNFIKQIGQTIEGIL